MKKVTISHTRLTTLNGQEQKNNIRKTASPFDDALKGLGVSQRKKESKKRKQTVSKV